MTPLLKNDKVPTDFLRQMTEPLLGLFFCPCRSMGKWMSVPAGTLNRGYTGFLAEKYVVNGPKEGLGYFFLGDLHDNIAICVVIVMAASGCPILTLP